ncbi:acyltransferase family protein [Konateibacter massiliensis]|uniref:acyltransferase family protein n=1 Tax=Konateibacter massiliensis TaxID=2002841 RepID=UPI000C15AB60|nr:acyltransferase [Konateibacter massiliensis]
MAKERNSSIELLRIISLLMIMCMHGFGNTFALFGGLDVFNSRVFIFINSLFNCGVTCFILITGYYGIKGVSLKKIVLFESMMIFYMVLSWIIKIVAGDFTSKLDMIIFLVKACIPFASRINWFYSCYMVLYLLSPFLNLLCEKFGKTILIKFIALLFILFSIFPTMFYFEIMQDYGKGVVNVILIYLIGRVIAMYFDNIKMPGKWFLGIITGIHFGLDLTIYEITNGIHNIFSRDNNVLVIVASIWLFYYFKSKNFYIKSVNIAATYVFPILVFHSMIMKLAMTKLIPKLSVLKYQNSKQLSLIILLYIFILIIIIAIVECIRRKVFLNLEIKVANLIERIYFKIEGEFKKHIYRKKEVK